MDSALMMVLVLGFISATTEEQKETIGEIPFPDAPPTFQRIEKVEHVPTEVNNDAEIFWEVTKTSKDAMVDVIDGNHPDNYEKTTHDHVDKTIGNVPPTKRVKKILPPFEGKRMRNARHIDGSKTTLSVAATKQETTSPTTLEKTTHEQTLEPANGTENLTENADTPTPPSDIQGIRLVPNEIGIMATDEAKPEGPGEEGDVDEEPAIQKSIWELLKEREQFNADLGRFDGVENGTNETETTQLPASKSLYEHFDDDSAEVEFETEDFNRGSNIEKHELPISYAFSWLQMKDRQFDVKKKPEEKKSEKEIPQDLSKLLKLSQDDNAVNGVTVSVLNSGNSDYPTHRPSKWYLLLLTGNSTIVKLRRKDFTKYLKLNLAARLSVEYDDVKVNKVILAPPKLLVNISVYAPSDDVAEESQLDFKINDKGEAPLYKLAETNATLLELSGEEYHVIRFLSLEEKPEAEAQKDSISVSITRQNDVEFIIYTFLGSACACALLLTFFITVNRYFKVSDFVWLKPKQTAWKVHKNSEPDKDEFDGISPAVIYSGGFPQIRGSWMSGVGGRNNKPPPSRRCPSIELGGSAPHRTNPVYPDLEERPCSSPRHNKLQIYNCDANSLVIPMPLQNKAIGKGKLMKSEGSDTHPLDVRISGEKTGQDNPIFTN